MARYYRRRYYRRRPRRYIRRYIKKRFRRFVNGSSKSTIRVKIPITTTFSLSTSSAGAVKSAAISPFALSNNNTSALASPLYRLYTQLYDEVKCIGGRVVLSVGTPVGTTSVPSLTILTAWDRRQNGTADPTPSYAELENYSSQKKAVAVNNSIAKLVRSCYASDLLEKAQWHDSTLAETSTSVWQDPAFAAAGANPNFFCPGMWLGCSISNDTAQTITFQCDITWYFAFRNPKYGGSAGPLTKDVEAMDVDGQLDREEQDIFDQMDATPEMVTGGGKVERKLPEPVTSTGFDNGRAKRVRVTQPKNV